MAMAERRVSKHIIPRTKTMIFSAKKKVVIVLMTPNEGAAA